MQIIHFTLLSWMVGFIGVSLVVGSLVTYLLKSCTF
jgi:hypothetical protein